MSAHVLLSLLNEYHNLPMTQKAKEQKDYVKVSNLIKKISQHVQKANWTAVFQLDALKASLNITKKSVQTVQQSLTWPNLTWKHQPYKHLIKMVILRTKRTSITAISTFYPCVNFYSRYSQITFAQCLIKNRLLFNNGRTFLPVDWQHKKAGNLNEISY